MLRIYVMISKAVEVIRMYLNLKFMCSSFDENHIRNFEWVIFDLFVKIDAFGQNYLLKYYNVPGYTTVVRLSKYN